MTGEYMELDSEFHLVTRDDGTVGIVPSLASIEATCQAAGIERMPDPCIQCARCTELQARLEDAERARDLEREECVALQARIDAMLVSLDSLLNLVAVTWMDDEGKITDCINAIRDAGKVQP